MQTVKISKKKFNRLKFARRNSQVHQWKLPRWPYPVSVTSRWCTPLERLCNRSSFVSGFKATSISPQIPSPKRHHGLHDPDDGDGGDGGDDDEKD
ncbi:hypothetical protein RvY_01808 [Ramazzottius varieornatus]|uniref:Uncharacterized protein n=1 Tax=Ramazzottius varieornatus TaxID=947166 RepID=A0A1D1UNL7_RAMVA|nr:hypothetical protein RvY_01808 [Ramazzottius varieornatus]